MLTAPRNMYGAGMFRLLYEELGFEKTRKILDVSESTLRRWLRGAIPVPKMAVLALYWESMYGRGLIDAEHTNEMRMVYGKIRSLEDELQHCKEIIAGLRKMDYGTANEPYFEELRKHHAYPAGSYEIFLQTAHSASDVPAFGEPHAPDHPHAPGGHELPTLAETAALPQRQKTRAVG
jgi:hypothetical protein